MQILEALSLGVIQGIVEWLPVSSEGMLVLVQTQVFHTESIRTAIEIALFLHLGTFFAALVYFRKEVLRLLRALIHYKRSEPATQSVLRFLVIATLMSGVLGFGFLTVVTHAEAQIMATTQIITIAIGVLLLVTAYVQFRSKKGGTREVGESSAKDAGILGVVQGFAALPGLSRSGLTVAALLLRGYSEQAALTLSFLMSLPIVLGGNIILNIKETSFSSEYLVGLLASFVFGYITIGVLLKIARNIQFAYFVLGFGILTILSAFV